MSFASRRWRRGATGTPSPRRGLPGTRQRAQGRNGSQCWDLSFATQAIAEARLSDAAYLEDCVVKAGTPPGTDPDHKPEVSQASPAFRYEDAINRKVLPPREQGRLALFYECARDHQRLRPEGLKSVFSIAEFAVCYEEGDAHLRREAVRRGGCHLALQNADGGFMTFENNGAYGVRVAAGDRGCSMASNGAF